MRKSDTMTMQSGTAPVAVIPASARERIVGTPQFVVFGGGTRPES